jgi:hypothetical protein
MDGMLRGVHLFASLRRISIRVNERQDAKIAKVRTKSQKVIREGACL